PPAHVDHAAMNYTLKQLTADPANSRWGSYYVLAGNDAVGVVGYKGAPRDGSVEVGYSLVPSFQGKGLATEAVAALVEQAFKAQGVHGVTAETWPHLIASMRGVEKSGFGLIGGGWEDGTIRFEIAREDYAAGHRDIPGYLRHYFKLLGHQTWADHAVLD